MSWMPLQKNVAQFLPVARLMMIWLAGNDGGCRVRQVTTPLKSEMSCWLSTIVWIARQRLPPRIRPWDMSSCAGAGAGVFLFLSVESSFWIIEWDTWRQQIEQTRIFSFGIQLDQDRRGGKDHAKSQAHYDLKSISFRGDRMARANSVKQSIA